MKSVEDRHLGALLAALLLPAAALAADAGVPLRVAYPPAKARLLGEFPFDRDGDHVALRARAFGRELRLLLDTGSSLCVFDERWKARLGSPRGKATVLFVDGSSVTLPTYAGPGVRLGRLKLCGGEQVAVWDFAVCGEGTKARYDGAIGLAALTDFVVQIDYDGGRVRFFERGSYSPGWGDPIPMRFAGDRFGAFRALAEVPGAGASEFILDTGGLISLRPEVFDRAALVAEATSYAAAWCGVDGVTQSSRTLLAGLVVGERPYPLMEVSRETNDRTSSLGHGFFKRHLVTFDFPNSRFFLKPGKGFDLPDALGPGSASGGPPPSSSAAAPAGAAPPAAPGVDLPPGPWLIREVAVEGARRLSPARILAALGAQAGGTCDRGRLGRGLRAVLALEAVADARLAAEPAGGRRGGVRLILSIRERPLVRSVALLPPLKESIEALISRNLDLSTGSFLRPWKVEADRAALRENARTLGWRDAVVESRVDVDTAAAEADVKHLIHLGTLHAFKEISLAGAKSFSQRRLLRAMRISPGFMYSETIAREALANLRKFYDEEGFEYVDLGTPTVAFNNDRTLASLRVEIAEGPRLLCGDAAFSGHAALTAPELARALACAPGKRYGPSLPERIRLLRELYADRGFLRARFDVSPGADRRSGRVKPVIRISEGAVIRLGRVEVYGASTPERRKAVEEGLLLRSGGVFRRFEVIAARRRVEALPFVEDVLIDLDSTPGAEDSVDLFFDVTERPSSP